MSKMDNFFKDKLIEGTQEVDGWNVPDEQLWENALPHLPKKKRRKSIFGYLFAILLIGSLGYWGYQKLDKQLVQNEIDIASETQHAQSSNDEVVVAGPHEDVEKDLIPEKVQSSVNQQGITKNESTKADFSNQELNKPFRDESISRAEEPEMIIPSFDEISNNQNETSVQSTLWKTKGENLSGKAGAMGISIKEGGVEKTTKSNNFKNRINSGIAKISPIQTTLVNTVKYERAKMSFLKSASIPVRPVKTNLPKREVGLYHLYKPIPFLTGEINLNEESDVLKVLFSYGNLGVSYNQWFKGRWSFSTGFAYSNLSTAFRVDVNGTLTSTDINSFINQQFGEIANQSSPASTSSELVINIKPGFTVLPGDEVNLAGDFDMNLDLYEIPFFINRHWFRNRFEYSVGVGGSVDFVHVSQGVRNISLTRNSELISEDVPYQEENEAQMFGAAYLVGGVKYNIHRRFNVGVTVRAALIQPVFSGFEVGMYYRWNRS